MDETAKKTSLLLHDTSQVLTKWRIPSDPEGSQRSGASRSTEKQNDKRYKADDEADEWKIHGVHLCKNLLYRGLVVLFYQLSV